MPGTASDWRKQESGSESWALRGFHTGKPAQIRKQQSDGFQANVWHQRGPFKVKGSVVLGVEEFWRHNRAVGIMKISGK